MDAILACVTKEVIAHSASMGATMAVETWIKAAIEEFFFWKELIAGVNTEHCLIFNQRYPWTVS